MSIRALANSYFGPVSLDVDPGECIAVRGASGAGKSVFLRAIVDLDASDGTITWRERERNAVPAPAWRHMIGYVPAETGWWADRVAEHFTATDDIAGNCQAVGLPPEAASWNVSRLSTGERHRLGLLRAVLKQPEVLLLDEPTAALDGDSAALIEQLLRQQLERGVAIILVTHDPAQAARLASRHFVMVDGRLSEHKASGP